MCPRQVAARGQECLQARCCGDATLSDMAGQSRNRASCMSRLWQVAMAEASCLAAPGLGNAWVRLVCSWAGSTGAHSWARASSLVVRESKKYVLEIYDHINYASRGSGISGAARWHEVPDSRSRPPGWIWRQGLGKDRLDIFSDTHFSEP